MRKQLLLFAAAVVLVGLLQQGGALAQTTTGAWTLYPTQATTWSVQVRPPIQADGSTVVRSHEVPIKFRLFTQPGPVVFQSIYSDGVDPTFPGTNDFSFLSFAPNPSFTFSQITTLKANYLYTMGNCGGGAIRWQVRVDIGNDGNPANDGNVFIYYGSLPSFTDCTSGPSSPTGPNQSGENLIGLSDLRYDLTQVGGTFYGSYANALALVGGLPVIRASLVVDTGWFSGDDKLDISNVMVNDNTFVPLSGSPARTCDLPPATIKITKLPSTPVGNPISVQPPASDTNFRVVDCMYIYNLAMASLAGPGTYKVEAVINGNPIAGAAIFTIP